MNDTNLSDILDYVDGFVLMDIKQLNAYEYKITLELIREYCLKSHNTAGNVHTI